MLRVNEPLKPDAAAALKIALANLRDALEAQQPFRFIAAVSSKTRFQKRTKALKISQNKLRQMNKLFFDVGAKGTGIDDSGGHTGTINRQQSIARSKQS